MLHFEMETKSKELEESLDADICISQELPQQAFPERMMIGNRERLAPAAIRMMQTNMTSALADYPVSEPLETGDGFSAGDNRQFGIHNVTVIV